MTVSEVLAKVRELKPTVQTDEILIRYINEIEGMAQTEVMRLDTVDVVQYTAEDMDKELLIGKPHHKMYIYYVMAMVDFGDGEYKKYQNGLQMANSTFDEWAKWWQRTYGTGCSRQYNVFLSAYGIAVKHGYVGSEEEWLLSLVGPQGPVGPEGPQGPRGYDGTVAFEELTEAQVEMLRGPAGKDGEPGAAGAAGAAGADGKDGKDGVSPTVSVTAIAGGHRVSITDASGTKTFDVMDGEDGEGGGGGSGENGATFYPYVDSAGNLSWTNDGDLENPETVNIKGPAGADGAAGSDGVSIQSVVQTTTSDADGGTNVITVTKTDGSTSTFSVKNGSKGSDGEAGPAGANATINGVNALTLNAASPIKATQSGSTLTLALDGDLPSGATANTYTLTTGGWSDNGDGRFKQTLSVPGVTTDASQVIMVDAALSGADLDADAEALDAWGPDDGSGPSSQNVLQGSGTLTFYCTAVPTVNIPVFVGVS